MFRPSAIAFFVVVVVILAVCVEQYKQTNKKI